MGQGRRPAQAKILFWSDSFAVGHDRLDAQHRGLLDAINDVEVALRREQRPGLLAKALKTLRERAVVHIRDENAFLWDVKTRGYEPPHSRLPARDVLQALAESALDQHMDAHYAMLARLEAIIAGPREALCDSLKKWFVDHTVTQDLPVKAIFQAVRPRS